MQVFIEKFTFNAFQQNTYLIYETASLKGILFDAGQESAKEKKILEDFISSKNIQIKHLVLTHSHLDHVFGVLHIYEKYGIKPAMHRLDYQTFLQTPLYAPMFGHHFQIPDDFPEPIFLEEGDQITLADQIFETIFVPGHAPGHLAFVNKSQKYLISGDVLFKNSVGRTDLMGSDFETLRQSIQEKIYILPEDFLIYPGHGGTTTVGNEKKNNPFIHERTARKI